MHGTAGSLGQTSMQRSRRKQSAPVRSCPDSALASSPQVASDSIKRGKAVHSPYINRTGTSPQHGVLAAVLQGQGQGQGIPAPADASTAAHFAGYSDAAALAGYADAAPAAGKARLSAKAKMNKSRGSYKDRCCSFCSATDSPLWRNGPPEYPRLCNACGMRYYRMQQSKSKQDPFSAKILANMHRKAAKAAAKAAQAAAQEPLQHAPAAPFLAPKAPGSTSLLAAVGMAASALDTGAAGTSPLGASPAAGKRVRKASAKAAALLLQEEEEGLWVQGLVRRNIMAAHGAGQEEWQHHAQWQEDAYEGEEAQGMQQQEGGMEAESDREERQHSIKRPRGSASSQASPAEQPDAFAAAAPAITQPVVLAPSVLQQITMLIQALPANEPSMAGLQGVGSGPSSSGRGAGAPSEKVSAQAFNAALARLCHMSSLDSAITGDVVV